MQVRKVSGHEWVPFAVVTRGVPTVVPIITHSGGRWGVTYELLRCTVESVLHFPRPAKPKKESRT